MGSLCLEANIGDYLLAKYLFGNCKAFKGLIAYSES